MAVDPSMAPYVAHTVKNIYAINNLFTTWYTALQYASNQPLTIVQDNILKFDPETQSNFILRDMLFAFTSNHALLKGANNAPQVARDTWPAGTQSSQSVQLANIENEPNNATSETAAMLNTGLTLLMSDPLSFVNFASTGIFSGSQPLSLPSQINGLDMALCTFIVSGAMA